MNSELVSIILPVFNGEKYLAQSIESVLAQTYKNIELIVVNDNSSDNSLSIMEEFAKRDDRVKVVSNSVNLKLPKSLNAGFALANGKYLTWTSDDNFYSPEAIELMVEYLQKHPNDAMVCANFTKINETNSQSEKISLEVSPQNMMKGNCVGACFLYRKEIADKVGEYKAEKFLVEDYDFWLRVMLEGNIGHIERDLYTYRVHNSSLTGQRIQEIMEKTEEIIKEYLPLYKKRFKNLKFDCKEHKFMKKIFSKTKTPEKKVYTVLGIKITLKRKQRKNEVVKKNKIDYLKKYYLAKGWIEKYTVDSNGIAVESNQPKTIYPEVTGYYIPTLIKFGDKKRALDYGNYLLSIQNPDGSWNAPNSTTPYTFDTGMILKGLAALVENNLDENDKYKNALIKGADYILSMQRDDGSIATVDYSAWALPYGKQVPEAIHIYCLEPIRKVAQLTGEQKYEKSIQKALDFYLAKPDLTDFTTLSHFNAYIIEGLIDIGEIERAQRAMDLISLYQRPDGSVSAYSNVDFVCSTGLFQYAICWYKLGEIKKADAAFEYACELQNKSGGWFGSYTKGRDEANYFPQGEIAWAVKYFLDAVYYGQKAKYEEIAHIFLDNIDPNDGRYLIIEENIKDDKYKNILDLGCGKARYTKRLKEKYPDKNFRCVDFSDKVLTYIDLDVEKKQGSILNIPYQDESFDFIYITEALEHAIDIDFAIKEIARVLKQDGKVVIIDKDLRAKGALELADFEQWFDSKGLSCLMQKCSLKTKVVENLEYENKKDGLFNAWIGEKA